MGSVPISLLHPADSTWPKTESQKHPRVQIGIYIMSLKPCRVTFLTRWWSAYALKQQRQIQRLPKFKKKKKKKKGGNCASVKLTWLHDCLFSWSSNCFLPCCCRYLLPYVWNEKVNFEVQRLGSLKGGQCRSQHTLCCCNGSAFLPSRGQSEVCLQT